MNSTMLTVKEVAKRLHISLSLVYRLVSRGELSSYRINAAIRVSEEQLANYLNAKQYEPPRRIKHF